MTPVSARAHYHAQMLIEPLTDSVLQEKDRTAFSRNLSVRVAETGDDLLGDAAAKQFQCAICLADVDRNPTSDDMVGLALNRLLTHLPVGGTIPYRSQAYEALLQSLHEELNALWRQRIDGLTKVKRDELWRAAHA